jgi:hypothetical protein
MPSLSWAAEIEFEQFAVDRRERSADNDPFIQKLWRRRFHQPIIELVEASSAVSVRKKGLSSSVHDLTNSQSLAMPMTRGVWRLRLNERSPQF